MLIWEVKKLSETEANISIAYGVNNNLDGIISYDKDKKKFEVSKKSKALDMPDSQRIFQYLHSMIADDTLSQQLYRICIC